MTGSAGGARSGADGAGRPVGREAPGRGVGVGRAWLRRAGLPARAVLVGLIRLYRVTLGGWVGGQCRFYPSCSHYAEGAIRQAGAVQGTALAVWRVLRCSPLSAGGVDYPPRSRLYDDDVHGRSAARTAVGGLEANA